MRRQAHTKRHELFVAASIIAAHANFSDTGFRQRNVRFLAELFANWTESSIAEKQLVFQNTQILRYLEDLVTDGFARKQSRNAKPVYRLTRVGLMELLNRLVAIGSELTSDLFFFLFYFVYNYEPKIAQLIEREGRQFPLALKIELEALLDWRSLIQAQIYLVETELRKLDARISDAYKASKVATDMFAKGSALAEVAAVFEKHYPYGLNSQKPLRELINEVPLDLQQWELETGGLRRAQHIWEPLRGVLTERLSALRRLEQNAAQPVAKQPVAKPSAERAKRR